MLHLVKTSILWIRNLDSQDGDNEQASGLQNVILPDPNRSRK